MKKVEMKIRKVTVDHAHPRYNAGMFKFNGLEVHITRQGHAHVYEAKLGEVVRLKSKFPTNKTDVMLQFMRDYQEYQKQLFNEQLFI